MNNIKLIRLVTGEELLANVVEQKANPFNLLDKKEIICALKLEKPVILVVTQKKSIALAPWCPYADIDGVIIDLKHVMFYVNIDPDLANHYIQTVTGIVTSAPIKE